MRKKTLLILLILGISSILLYLGLFQKQNISVISSLFQPDAIITLEKEGFIPEKITIKKGQTVQFQTSNETFFWPASNLHPTHELYAEFDPQEPVDPKDSWNFKFNETGQWQFHDHLAPYYTGMITVVD